MAEKWIQRATSRNKGAFTREAKSAGESVQGFASQVNANPSRYSTRTRRRANLARTLRRMNRRSSR